MTRDRMVEQLTDWLEDQPSRAPVSVLEAALADVATTRQRRGWRRRLPGFTDHSTTRVRFAAALVSVVLVALLGTGLYAGLRVLGPHTGGCQLPAAPSAARVSTIDVDGPPAYVTFAACSLWVATSTTGNVQRIDPLTNEIVATISIGQRSTVPGGTLMAVAAQGDQVWAATRAPANDRRLVRIDPASNTVVEEFAVSVSAYQMLIVDGRAWLANLEGSRIEVVDLSTGESVEVIALTDGPVQIDDGFGAVWARSGSQLVRIDTRTFEQTRFDVPGGRAIYVSVSETGVWSASPEGGIFKLSPEGQLLLRIESETEPTRTAVLDGSVYVSVRDLDGERDEVVRIDDATGELVERIALPSGFGVEMLSAAGGSIWGGNSVEPPLVRIETP